MARDLLGRLREAGLTVSRNGDQIIVMPRQRLTDELRAAIRDAKTELLLVLGAEQSTDHRPFRDLEDRIRTMAKRWGYSSDELADALARAKSDPKGWLAWTEADEQDFGMCQTPEDFARQYARLRGLA
jgi:precorrin-2 methylase